MKPVEDLQKIKGIGKVTVRRIKDSGVTDIVDGSDPAAASGPIDVDQGERYNLIVSWDAETAQVGVGSGGIRKLFLQGTVQGRPSDRIRLAGKHNSESDYEALAFAPKHAVPDIDVYVNGEFVGKSNVSYTSKYEWGIEREEGSDWGVQACWVKVPLNSPWLEATAQAVGVVLGPVAVED